MVFLINSRQSGQKPIVTSYVYILDADIPHRLLWLAPDSFHCAYSVLPAFESELEIHKPKTKRSSCSI